jgi:hypothetical protein
MLQHNAKGDSWVLPEPAWTIADYSTQCENDAQHTFGAFVIYDVENDSGIVNAVAIQDSFTHLFARALFISCSPFLTSFDEQGIRSSTVTITATGTATPPPNADSVAFSEQPTTLSDAEPYTGAIPPSKPGQQTITYAQKPAGTSTTSLAKLPGMEVQWVTKDDVKGFSNPLSGIIFAAGATAAAVGAYFSARQISQTNTVTKTGPLVPGTPTTNGSVTYTNTQMNNNSLLPYGIALLGGSLTPLSSLTVGAANQTSLLKQAAARMSQKLWAQIRTTRCVFPSRPEAAMAVPAPRPTAAPTPDPQFCGVLNIP